MQNDLSKIRQFEQQLDQQLSSLPSLNYDGEECIALAINIIEHCHVEKNYGAAGQFERGLEVLAPYFVKKRNQEKPLIEQLALDLVFACHYFMLREYLYYTYNAPDSIGWYFDKQQIKLKFQDPTIPRQFFLQANNHLMVSSDIFSTYEDGTKIKELLKGEDQFVNSPKKELALEFIEKEADMKLRRYYSFLSPSDPVTLGSYTYSQFFLIFRLLLIKALYHRYFSELTGESGSIIMPFSELVHDISEDSGLSPRVCAAIIKDISYSRAAEQSKIQPMYFSLYYLDSRDQIIMSPYHFATWEGFINIFRLTALRQPGLFLENISGPLAIGLVEYIEKLFSRQGFKCLKNVKLSQIDHKLPDIDLLVISEERTFGYVLYCCEIKNPIPPQWAKDHLRVLGKDSVSKAFEQIDLIKQVVKDKQGIEFFRDQILNNTNLRFPEGFVLGLNFLIITSRNAGMFFGNKDQAVIDYITLERILNKCDGDIAYVMDVLGNIVRLADECLKLVSVTTQLGSLSITYEAVEIGSLLEFQQNSYKSIGLDVQFAKQFIEDGGHPFDVFNHLSENDELDSNKNSDAPSE